jgi:predicted dehydrogenase
MAAPTTPPTAACSAFPEREIKHGYPGFQHTAARRIRLGMVGGGRDAFIGGVHRIASRIDDRYELVAGAFSSTPEKSKASAADLGVAPDRAYGDYVEMAKREARLKNGIEAVAIVTPNHMHYPVAREFLKRGIHVICDKPLTSTLADAKKLAKAAETSGALFVLTHNYTGYPMIRQAREMVSKAATSAGSGRAGGISQDWLAENARGDRAETGGWRTDPARSGLGGSIGDIGTHAFNLAISSPGLERSSAPISTASLKAESSTTTAMC